MDIPVGEQWSCNRATYLVSKWKERRPFEGCSWWMMINNDDVKWLINDRWWLMPAHQSHFPWPFWGISRHPKNTRKKSESSDLSRCSVLLKPSGMIESLVKSCDMVGWQHHLENPVRCTYSSSHFLVGSHSLKCPQKMKNGLPLKKDVRRRVVMPGLRRTVEVLAPRLGGIWCPEGAWIYSETTPRVPHS